MDPAAVFERADATEYSGDLHPQLSDETTWVATDPETGCQGLGSFEAEARTNLVRAVEAYLEDPEQRVPYVGAGSGYTMEMTWHDEYETSLTDRLRDVLPF